MDPHLPTQISAVPQSRGRGADALLKIAAKLRRKAVELVVQLLTDEKKHIFYIWIVKSLLCVW
jgi:hypothetical protein